MPTSLAAASNAPSDKCAPLDYYQLLERCLGNVAFAERILAKFIQKFAEDLERLETSASAGDAEAATLVAHRLKGSAANVAAAELAWRLSEIEQLSRDGEWLLVAERMEALREQWTRFVAFTLSLSKESQSLSKE